MVNSFCQSSICTILLLVFQLFYSIEPLHYNAWFYSPTLASKVSKYLVEQWYTFGSQQHVNMIHSKRNCLFSLLSNIWRFASLPLHINFMKLFCLIPCLKIYFILEENQFGFGTICLPKAVFSHDILVRVTLTGKNKYFPIFFSWHNADKHFQMAQ